MSNQKVNAVNQNKSNDKPLSFGMKLIAGGMAGISEILVMYPMDVIKTRYQLQSSGNVDTNRHKSSILGTLRNIVRNEGFWKLYRGILPPILLESPKRAIKFSCNEQYTPFVNEFFSSTLSGQMWMVPVTTGLLAGWTEAFIVVPFDLVKIRLQDPNSSSRYNGTFDCVTKIAREEGIQAFGKGLGSTLWRHGIWSAIYFGLIGKIKSTDTYVTKKSEYGSTMLLDFGAGLVAGTLATAGNTPFDVVKTRVQNNIAPYDRISTISGLFKVAKSEGVKSLWKGFAPKVIRLGPGGGLMLVIYQKASDWLRQNWT